MPLWPQLKAILRSYFPLREQVGPGTLLFPSYRTGREAMVTDFRKLLDAIGTRAGWQPGEIRSKMFRHTYITTRLQTLDQGAPVSIWTVAREVGHKDTDMIERVYGHLGTVRRRAKSVEYRVPATIDWRPIVVLSSIAIAIAVAGGALWFAFRYGRPTASAWSWRKVGTSLLMGAAIPAMHYTGMAAAQFRAAPPHDLGRAVDISVLGAYAIAAATMVLLAMAIGTSLVSRYGEARYRTLATELQQALTEVRTLQGILPICASCKRIQNDAGGWQAVESFVRERTDAEFSHGLCPDCAARDWGASPTPRS